MRVRMLICCVLFGFGLTGCIALRPLLCGPCQRSGHEASSTLVGFLYPQGDLPSREAVTPELHLPLRVGLAFLPSVDRASPLDETQKEQLLERIRQRFAGRGFVRDIVLIPDYYLADRGGFAGLAGVQRIYNVDLMALVSYDQTRHEDENNWSLGYLTIVGAYVLRGERHDISTLVDLAVIDPGSRSLVLRAGGVDLRHGSATWIDEPRLLREAERAGFSAATDQMIEHFDVALTKFEADVRAGTANVRVVSARGASSGGGGGAVGWPLILVLLPLAVIRAIRRHRGERNRSLTLGVSR